MGTGSDRQQRSGADPNGQPESAAPSPGKQTLVGAPLEPAAAAAPPTPGKQSRVHSELEATGVGAAAAPSHAPTQRAPTSKPQPQTKGHVPFRITVARPMTREQFEAAANLQVFGTADVGGHWHNVRDSYTPDQSPVEVLFDTALVHRLRGAANAAKGIETDASGNVAGGEQRASDFQAQPASDEKSALLAEIDRRYYAASGDRAGTKIKAGETGKSDLWRAIRDEVLFQHQAIATLPEKVKTLIHAGVRGRDLSPADYDQLFRIAKNIEALPPGAAADFASKLTGATPELAMFESSIERYRTELASREQADVQRTAAQNKLLGLEEVYALYRQYRTTPIEAAPPDLRERLQQQLRRYGFASIADFAAYVTQFEKAFEQGAAQVALDVLAKYAGKLYQESQRYQDPAVVKDLHGRLGGFRAEHQAFEKNAKVWNAYAAQHDRDAAQSRLPGSGHVHPQPPTPAQAQAGENARAAKAGAEASIRDLSKDFPLFAEDELPPDKRVDKTKLAHATETQLASLLQAHIAERTAAVTAARGELEANHALVYKMDRLRPTFYAQMDIRPGSIHDQILQDKLHDDAITKLVGGIALAIIAVALTVVSLGTATPAVIATGASIGAAGLSTYMAYDEYKQYTADHAIADAGFADDPSVAWVVLAIVGAGIDMAAAAKAMHTLGPAAKALEAGGDAAAFDRAVEAVRREDVLGQRIAAATDKAKAARESFATAKTELGDVVRGRAYSFPGPFTDPDVYRSLVKMAAAKLKQGGHSLAAFIDDLKLARIQAKLGELSPEELTKAKQAWEDADRLAKSATTPVDIASESGKVIGTYSHGSRLEIISKDVKLHGGNTIDLHPDATTTVTGTLDDTNAVARRGERLPGSTQMGENPGGINILRSPKWSEIQLKYKPLLDSGDTTAFWNAVTNEFWETVKKPWLDEAIARGDRFRLISNPADESALFVTTGKDKELVLDRGKRIQSIFGRELDYLRTQGYTILPDGTAVRVK